MQNPAPLADKVALITGGSRGLGRATALALAKQGAKLALVARDEAALQSVAKEVSDLGAEAAVFVCDVTMEVQVKRLEQEVIDRFHHVDILINNAGVNVRKDLPEFSIDEWYYVINGNLTSVFLMCRAFVPHMKGRGWGRIVNLTSIMSHVSLPGRTVYSTSKAGLLGFTKALALELASEGITVVGVSPGPFATEMNTPLLSDPEKNAFFVSRIPVGRWGRVEEVGDLVAFLCSDQAGFITGTDIVIDGGWCAQ